MTKTKLTVVLEQKVGQVNPNIFGHFAEHLGRCIYEGIYVGEYSSISNTRGIRNDVVAALKKINPQCLDGRGVVLLMTTTGATVSARRARGGRRPTSIGVESSNPIISEPMSSSNFVV